MDDLKVKIDSLTREVRDLSKELREGYEEIKKLRAKAREQREEIVQKDDKVEELNVYISKLKKQIDERTKEVGNRERAIMNECRRKELFNDKVLGSSRSRGEYYISLEMKVLNTRVEIMRRFILEISKRFGFDFEIFDELSRISENSDDPVISALLDSISPDRQPPQEKRK
ncbi:hypothetical protein EHEL_081950 [Encephalitozoon hellem ATCC 50504]|uniref:Uncharacterized protein n=1 Tax=Encephalitozoon hellem TaxID=27973 RepID=A0A9Q9CBJ1_ENCHE|nr:uncharacterized protein EHEL_081950 [Encephalitozoon hellem ATCC 50504]AFM98893.1 hypothetical protein EHEL_081950 [Encephalitozoon hellem ATCC 50504]UTX43873.1 hypothetical protein GPU96_08g16490 [Encephalitozoon hellem]WEL39352.1 hypothetical protein PFJ87_08g02200 [Encephalitozoon hellem]|eukprot:XP_003887874.1 hypothetical protein EHEL_081950 [Encephalitozoon hellem ATCC 50504]